MTTRQSPDRAPSARFVRIPLAAELTGYSVQAIETKIRRGVWLERREYVRAPDGAVLIDMDGYERWVQGAVPIESVPPPPTGLRSLLLSEEEIADLTDYRQPAKQLAELRRCGFFRACRSQVSGRIMLERAHYEAVCQQRHGPGEPGKPGPGEPIWGVHGRAPAFVKVKPPVVAPKRVRKPSSGT